MRRITVAIAALLCSTSLLVAQNDPIVIEVGNQKVRQSEFVKEFNDNVGRTFAKRTNVTVAEKRAAMEEYAELYATFLAKKQDALALGYDTSATLKSELNHYRKDLAAPYLIDSTVLEQLMAEAYERNHVSLRAAHILVPLRVDATPDDTLAAYKRIVELRRRVVEGGENFNAVALEVMRSLNPQVPDNPNAGDLGYFSVFDMIYPFENAAYALKIGEVSQPVRTRFGYHLIKLLDRVEGLYGELTMAHIWLHSPDSATRRFEINQIYQQLVDGTPFEKLTYKSDDRTTAENGGVLSNATLQQLPPEYIHQLVGMKEGDFSKPFFTQYGWHIIKLIHRDSLPTLKELEGFYKQRMSRDQRGDASRRTFAANSRKKYGIIDCTVTPVEQPRAKKNRKKAPAKMMASLDYLVSRIDEKSLAKGEWKFERGEITDTTPLIITPDHRYTALDVAKFIRKHQQRGLWTTVDYYVQVQFETFLDSVSIAYADSQLENNYPEFAKVVDDYRTGLMIFNYNDAMIWRKAALDTAGFADFYARESKFKRLDNPDDSIFFFHPRARVTIINVADSQALPSAKALKLINKAHKKSMGSSEMKQLLLKNINRKQYPADNLVECDVELVEQTRQTLLADDQWATGVYLKKNDNGYLLLSVDEILPRSLKSLGEARGYYLSAWQSEVENRLHADLRAKYNVKIHRDAIRSINL